jgi:ferritin-like metal-binding protein YciE
MSQLDQKVVQYLNEAHASEVALVSVLQSQIAMSPRGSYRDALQRHLDETRTHARRIEERLEELGQNRNPFQTLIGLTETMIGQAFALSKMPFDLLLGSGSAEKALKNAQDASATEALEIATYIALERLAINGGDEQTSKLAASIRADEERMLERILGEIPKLTDAMFGAEIDSHPSYEVSETGAADAVREVASQDKRTTRAAPPRTKRTASGRAPGGARVKGRPEGAAVSEQELPIRGYGSLSADDIVSRLHELSQIDLAKVGSYERSNQNRGEVLSRISELSRQEPWPGYDELSAAEIEAVLGEGDDQRAQDVTAYERTHQNRPEVLQSALTPARFVLTRNT